MSDLEELGKRRARELGLQLINTDPKSVWHFYRPYDIHRLLGEAKFMSCSENDIGLIRALQPSKEEAFPGDTHKALLIGIRPIIQESEERRLLRDLVIAGTREEYTTLLILAGRAKELLERKD